MYKLRDDPKLSILKLEELTQTAENEVRYLLDQRTTKFQDNIEKLKDHASEIKIKSGAYKTTIHKLILAKLDNGSVEEANSLQEDRKDLREANTY